MNPKPGIADSIKLIRNIKTTGTVTPSSKALIRRMLAPVDFAAARCIVEFGPGNGCITRELLSRMAPEARLLCMEVNNDFAARITRMTDDPRLQVHNACASTLQSILSAQPNPGAKTPRAETHCANIPGAGNPCADYIISSLPLALLNDDTVAAIIQTARQSLCPEGRFLQYQYSLAHYADLKSVFNQVRLHFTLRNMPPAFVYECSP